MLKLHVIGIGGTGHKLLTALIHLAACGAFKGQLGANKIDQIRVVTIDADDANGNLALARRTLAGYQQFYQALSAAPSLGLIPIEAVTPKTNIRLFKQEQKSISEAFNIPQYNTQDIDKFIRFLYTDAEIDAEFEQGFYGHTSIGTLVNFSNEAASRGAAKQCNKAHPIELFAASAIVDFIKESNDRQDGKIITAERDDSQNLIYENIHRYLTLFVDYIRELHTKNLGEVDQNSGRNL